MTVYIYPPFLRILGGDEGGVCSEGPVLHFMFSYTEYSADRKFKNQSHSWSMLILHVSVLRFKRMLLICQFLVCYWH